jgi:hypothetical protein
MSGLAISLIALHSRKVPPRPRQISMLVFTAALRKLTPHLSMVLTRSLQPFASPLHARRYAPPLRVPPRRYAPPAFSANSARINHPPASLLHHPEAAPV